MTDIRAEVQEEIDRMTEEELLGLKEFLSNYPSRVAAVFRNAPWSDEPLTEEERIAIAESHEWFKQNDGRGIPHEEVVKELGLD